MPPANGDILTINTSLPGGGGSIDGQDKFEWVPPATPPTPAIPSWEGSYLNGIWYAPGPPTAKDGLNYAGITADIIYAVPALFTVAGTITDIAAYNAGNGGASTNTYYAIYRSNAARTAPSARIWSGEVVATNFVNAKTEFNGVNLSVSAGELLWFAAVSKGASSLAIVTANLHALLGTNFDGTGGANPLRAFIVGYREAFTYAQPPDPWTATTKLLHSSDAGTGVPVCLAKFTPT